MTTVCYQGTLLIDFKERKYKVLRRRQRKIFIGAQLCLIFLAVLKLWINREPIDGYIQLHSYATTPNRFTATLYCRTLKIELAYFSFFCIIISTTRKLYEYYIYVLMLHLSKMLSGLNTICKFFLIYT